MEHKEVLLQKFVQIKKRFVRGSKPVNKPVLSYFIHTSYKLLYINIKLKELKEISIV